MESIITQSQLSVEELERMKQIIAQTELQNKKPAKHKMTLEKTDKEGLRQGTNINGKKYSVRDDRHRFFFPQEWIKFIECIKPKKRMIFKTLLHTGGRINEILHLEPHDFDWERKLVCLRVTKVRHAIGERAPKRRMFVCSTEFIKEIKQYIKQNNIGDNQKIFTCSKQAVAQMLRRGLLRAEIKDYYQFSVHNIRKTCGNYLRALRVDSGEICMRLGHSMDILLKSYASPDIFTPTDYLLIRKIMGDIYERKQIGF